MSNIVKHNNDSSLYIQSVERQQDSLVLRKKIAHDLWLTSIGEFIQWWAVVNKDNRRRLVNEKGEYMRDPTIKNLEHKRLDTSPKWYIWFSHKEGNINGNGDFVEKEEDNVDIIQSKNWIFPAKDGIIIVVDHRWFCKARLYTTDGQRIPIPEWWQLDPHAIPDRGDAYSIYDDFTKLRSYILASTDVNSSVFDWRKSIVHGRFAVDLSSKMREKLYSSDPQNIKKHHNLFNNCTHNLIDKRGDFFSTQLGDCYANSKRPFDGSCWLLPCIHGWLSDGTLWTEEDRDQKFTRPIFYAVDIQWHVFKDEFDNTLMFDDPYWLNNFDAEWYAPIVIDKKISPIRLGWDSPHPYTEYGAYICFINISGQYRKGLDSKVIIVPFYKTQKEHTVTSNDVKGYRLFPDQKIMEVRQLSSTEPWFRWVQKEIYKYFDYHGKEVSRHMCFNDNGQEKWMDKIDRWDTEDRVYQDRWNGLVAYGQGTKMEYGHYIFSYGWETKIANKNMDYKIVKFPDDNEAIPLHLDHEVDHFSKWYILYDDYLLPIEYKDKNGKEVKQWHTYGHIKVNGLIARYTKDEEGQELKSLNHMVISVDSKYLFVQRKVWEPYYILNQSFAYVKNKEWKKLEFMRMPFYTDGIFLSYDYDDALKDTDRRNNDMVLKKAYFEDGSLVWLEAPSIDKNISIWWHKSDIFKALK